MKFNYIPELVIALLGALTAFPLLALRIPATCPNAAPQCLVELFGRELTGGGRSSTAVLSLG